MSPSTPAALPPSPRQDAVMLGIGLKVISVAFFLTMASLLKASPGVPLGEMVFFRSFFGIVPVVVFLAWRGDLVEGFKTDRPIGHFWRGFFAVGGMVLTFYALTQLPLPEAIALGYTTPLLIVVAGALLLGETVRLYRWSAVAVGMVGVGVILWPRLTVFAGGGEVSGLTLGALSSLGGCVFAAIATIQVRKLVATERSTTIALYFSISCSIAGLATLPFGWVWPTPALWITLVGSGIAGGIGQILLTEAYRHADVSVIAPFDYTSLLLSLVVGYLVFSDVPTPQMLIGATIVVGAGLFIIYREHALGLDRRKAREATPPPPG